VDEPSHWVATAPLLLDQRLNLPPGHPASHHSIHCCQGRIHGLQVVFNQAGTQLSSSGFCFQGGGALGLVGADFVQAAHGSLLRLHLGHIQPLLHHLTKQ
jgi:hypothetical protein